MGQLVPGRFQKAFVLVIGGFGGRLRRLGCLICVSESVSAEKAGKGLLEHSLSILTQIHDPLGRFVFHLICQHLQDRSLVDAQIFRHVNFEIDP